MPATALANRPVDEESIARSEIATRYGGNSVAYAPVIERLRRAVEFNGFAFSGLDLDHCHVGRGLFLVTNLPDAMTDLYLKQGLIAADPIARRVLEDSPVVRWQDVKDDIDLSDPKATQLLQLLEFYAVAPRTTFTFWSRGQMYGSATFTRDRPFDDSEIQVLSVLAKAVHGHLAHPIVRAINRRLGLTRGELACLRAAAEGMTSDEIAAKVDYTLETVNTYLKNATRKLNAGNRTQAIAQAIRRGIIE